MARGVERVALLVGKTLDAHTQTHRHRRDFAQLGGRHDPPQRRLKRRQGHGQAAVLQQPLQVADGVGHALEKMGLALVEAAIAVGAHGLQDADEGEPAIKLLETDRVDRRQRGRGLQILRLELVAEIERQVRLGVEQQRGEVVRQRAAPSPLVIDEPRLAVAHHDVA